MTHSPDGTETAPADAAVVAARRVVGLYGDPDVSWSIVLALGFTGPREPAAVEAAAAGLGAREAHLGRPAEVARYAVGDEDDLLARFAQTPYGDHDPLLRIALSQDGRTLVLAAHHGAVDGLGMIGVASVLAGIPITSSARGIEPSAEPRGFIGSSVRRLAEALLHPPARLAASRPEPAATGDWLVSRQVRASRPSSGALVMAAVASVRRWNLGARRARSAGATVVVAMGLSRRPGTPTPRPDRDTAYVRLVADVVTSTEEATDLIAVTVPEPAFPVSDGRGIAPRVVRMLSGRLGSTLLVSNLGRLEGRDLEDARFWPVPAGPAGTAIGLASAGGTTTVSVRLRRGWFGRAEAVRFAELVAGELERAAR